ncbi:MAG: PAS domain-containing protein, partial [Planctomycetaceae bacterium]|nr:PAS domain-containing protein [Planctomycetaceae bacterium]
VDWKPQSFHPEKRGFSTCDCPDGEALNGLEDRPMKKKRMPQQLSEESMRKVFNCSQDHLLSSIDSATVLLDPQLCLQRFTPSAAKFFSLSDRCIGRSIGTLERVFDDEHLIGDCELAFSDLGAMERQIRTDDDSWYLRRAFPFRTSDDHIDGVVITFTNITELRHSLVELQKANEELEHQIEERTGAIQLLFDVASAANEADTIQQAVAYVLQRVCEYNGWVFGYILVPDVENPDELIVADMRYESEEGRFTTFWKAAVGTHVKKGSTLPGKVYELGTTAWLADVNDDWLERELKMETEIMIGSAIAFPVMVEKRVVAVMEFFSDQISEPDEELIETMQSVGTQLGRIIERKNLEKQAALATLTEQRRIGRELHDTALQQLAGSSLLMESLIQDLREHDSPLVSDAARIGESLQVMQEQLRAISRGLMPVEVEAGGLTTALQLLADRTSYNHHVDVKFQERSEYVIAESVTATNLYHIAQESVHNAIKHANATEVVIQLDRRDDVLILSVTDNGKGMDVDQTEIAGMGRRIMRYRAGMVGASLEITSPTDIGTRISCVLPISAVTNRQ